MKRDGYFVTLIVGCVTALILDLTLLAVWAAMTAMINGGKLLTMSGITPFAIFTAVSNFLLLIYVAVFIAIKRK